jgi:hypothetical protein
LLAGVVVFADFVYTTLKSKLFQKLRGRMRFLRVCASVVALASSASLSMRAQTAEVGVQTIGAVHMAALQAGEGVVRVYVSADAAAGDTISGQIVAEPAGATAQVREANLGRLNGFIVEWQSQQTPVSERGYEWRIPRTLRTGSATLVLRDSQRGVVSQASVPVDPVPAPSSGAPSAADAFELPSEGQGGMTAVIRGPSDGKLAGKTVTLGATETELLAASPRQLVFVTPETTSGPVMIRFTDGKVIAGPAPLRIILVQGVVPALGPGQKYTLKVTVSGLSGIKEPVRLTLRDKSPTIFRVENIDRPIIIEPGQVTRQGTYVVSRQITGVRGGAGNILKSVGSRPLVQFDPQRRTNRLLDDWQSEAGVRITPDASVQIQRSVVAAQTRLDDFLSGQQANDGDVQAVFAALFFHYCYDLRDDSRSRRRVADGAAFGPRIRLVALGQSPAGGAEITAGEVGRLSFSDFLSRLIGRFSEQQAVGYLFVSSTPADAPITLDGQRKGEATNRRFVTSVGDHTVVVAGRQTCRPRVTVSAFQTKVVDCGS